MIVVNIAQVPPIPTNTQTNKNDIWLIYLGFEAEFFVSSHRIHYHLAPGDGNEFSL